MIYTTIDLGDLSSVFDLLRGNTYTIDTIKITLTLTTLPNIKAFILETKATNVKGPSCHPETVTLLCFVNFYYRPQQ